MPKVLIPTLRLQHNWHYQIWPQHQGHEPKRKKCLLAATTSLSIKNLSLSGSVATEPVGDSTAAPTPTMVYLLKSAPACFEISCNPETMLSHQRKPRLSLRSVAWATMSLLKPHSIVIMVITSALDKMLLLERILDTCEVKIGDRCNIGPNVNIYTATLPVDPKRRLGSRGPNLGRKITIDSDCWIGGGVTILPGRTIGKGSTVGAGSIVTRVRLPSKLTLSLILDFLRSFVLSGTFR
jgi:hypothetical protein